MGVLNQRMGHAVIEKRSTTSQVSGGMPGGAWSVGDLVEVVLMRYRERHPEKTGSRLFGATRRWAVVGEPRAGDRKGDTPGDTPGDGGDGDGAAPGVVMLTSFLGGHLATLHIVHF